MSSMGLPACHGSQPRVKDPEGRKVSLRTGFRFRAILGRQCPTHKPRSLDRPHMKGCSNGLSCGISQAD